MRNREPIMKKIEQLESELTKMVYNLNINNRNGCYDITESMKEKLDQIKTFIEMEPIEGSELM